MANISLGRYAWSVMHGDFPCCGREAESEGPETCRSPCPWSFQMSNHTWESVPTWRTRGELVKLFFPCRNLSAMIACFEHATTHGLEKRKKFFSFVSHNDILGMKPSKQAQNQQLQLRNHTLQPDQTESCGEALGTGPTPSRTESGSSYQDVCPCVLEDKGGTTRAWS